MMRSIILHLDKFDRCVEMHCKVEDDDEVWQAEAEPALPAVFSVLQQLLVHRDVGCDDDDNNNGSYSNDNDDDGASMITIPTTTIHLCRQK